MMIDYILKHRWLTLVFNLLAIPVGLLLIAFGRQWLLLVTKNARNLPDFGGHFLEFLVFVLFGVLVFTLGCGASAGSVYALITTRYFKRPIDDLPLLARNIVVVVSMVAVGLTTLGFATGMFLVLLLLVLPS
jgi:hypothetical protein